MVAMAICSAATKTTTMILPSTPSSSSLSTPFISPITYKPSAGALLSPVGRQFALIAVASSSGADAGGGCAEAAPLTKRSLMMISAGTLFSAAAPMSALADIEEDYKKETQEVITQVRATLTLDKADPSRGDAVKALRDSSNQWVAKYRREKRFAGKPSYSNIYSVLNAVSGHYISYGDGAPLPAKRKTQILEEVESAEKALNRGR